MVTGKIQIKPQGFLGRFADRLMTRVMYKLQGNYREIPQRTHFWNNRKLKRSERRLLRNELMASASADPEAIVRRSIWDVRFHMPKYGGWETFVVIEPVVPLDVWFVGWVSRDVKGISLIPLSGQVRLLRGSRSVRFFGVDRQGKQIKVRKLKFQGHIGNAGRFASVPLL